MTVVDLNTNFNVCEPKDVCVFVTQPTVLVAKPFFNFQGTNTSQHAAHVPIKSKSNKLGSICNKFIMVQISIFPLLFVTYMAPSVLQYMSLLVNFFFILFFILLFLK